MNLNFQMSIDAFPAIANEFQRISNKWFHNTIGALGTLSVFESKNLVFNKITTNKYNIDFAFRWCQKNRECYPLYP